MSTSAFNYINNLEEVISRTVRSAYPKEWNENFISYNLCKNLRRFLNRTNFFGFERAFSISCDSFKLTGTEEKKHGDIALLIAINNWDGKKIYGVGFIEAKKKYINSEKYDKIDFNQLKHIYANTPHSLLLLYDYQPITEFENNLPLLSEHSHHFGYAPFSSILQTNAGLLPTNLAIELNEKGTRLHKYTHPLSYQIVGRYFKGYDLEFRDDIKSNINNFSIDKFDLNPDYILSIGIGVDRAETELIIPNRDIYNSIE